MIWLVSRTGHLTSDNDRARLETWLTEGDTTDSLTESTAGDGLATA